MTVGMAAIADAETDEPKVVVSSDRLVTTRQQSAIEHEHPETKIAEFGEILDQVHIVAITAGSVQLGEVLRDQIEEGIKLFVNEQNEEPWVETVAEIAGREYRALVRKRVERLVLQDYGLEMDDLSRQHQFKDEFLNDILAEADTVRQQTHQNLGLLLGGVGPMGPGIYNISQNEVIPQNEMGYSTIGSGTQPAESEFIKHEYGKSDPLDKAFATVAAANYQAQKASGVGGEPDIYVVSPSGATEVDESTCGRLMDRQEEIADEQDEIRQEKLEGDQIEWSVPK